MLLVDAYVRPKDEEELNKILELEERFGYRAIGVGAHFLKVSKNKILTFPVRVVSAESEEKAKVALKECKKGELVISRPRDPGSLRVFSRDKRSHIVEIPPKLIHLMDRNEAEILKVGKSFIGFSLSTIIYEPKNYWWLSFLLNYSIKYNVNFIIFSGATRFEELVHPKIALSILMDAGVSREIALKILDGSRLLKTLGFSTNEEGRVEEK